LYAHFSDTAVHIRTQEIISVLEILLRVPDICFIVSNAAAIDFFNLLVQNAQHFFLIIGFELPERKHPTARIT